MALCHVVLLSVRMSKQGRSRQNLQASEHPLISDKGHNPFDQSTGNVGGLIKFLQSQKTEAEWMEGILSRQIRSLEPIAFQPFIEQ